MLKTILIVALIFTIIFLFGCSSTLQEQEDPNSHYYFDEPNPLYDRGDTTSFTGKVGEITKRRGDCFSIFNNGYHRVKFKPLKTAYYHFVWISEMTQEENLPLYLEFFYKYVGGKSDEGLISRHTINYICTFYPERNGVYAYKKLYKNQKFTLD